MRHRPRRSLPLLLAALALAGPASALTFEDAHQAAGIDFHHASSLQKNYPETNGSGACWGDLDGDGTDDLFLVNGKFSNATEQAVNDPRSALYLNRGNGTFTDVSEAWGADLSSWGQGCSLADYDDDADLDLLVAGYGFLALLRNDGDRLTDATAAANLSLEGKCGDFLCFAESGSFADYDGDGDLDLYIANMVDYDLVDNAGDPIGPAFYDGQPNVLFRNRGDGTFEDVTAEAGVDDDPGPNRSKSFMSLWGDVDRDGDPDLYIASDTTPNTLFRNNGDGTFTDVATAAGVDDDRSSMGLVLQDIDHDGLPDLYMTHYKAEHNGFYRNDGDGTFTDHSGEGELGTDLMLVGWGAGFHDFDHDGDHDLYAVNGHTLAHLPDFRQKLKLWLRLANGTFDDASAQAGPAFQNVSAARGSAVSDYDLDGDLDLLVLEQHNNASRLLRNGGNPGVHWLQVEARQPGPRNRFALGAEVTIAPPGGLPLTRILQTSGSFLSQDTLVVHAGLGSATTADVTVRWPDGAVETWTGVAADQRVRVVRGSADVVRDTLSPLSTFQVNGTAPVLWYNTPVQVTVTSTDRARGLVSGVALQEAALDDGPLVPYLGPLEIATDGRHVVRARATDAVGNREPLRTLHVALDRTPPTSEVLVTGEQGDDGWYRGVALVGFNASDGTSGVARVWSRVDDGPWEADRRWVFGTSGTRRVTWYAEDLAGNAEAPRDVVVRVDREKPAVELRPWPALGLGSLLLEADATDASSGVRQVAFFVDGAAAPAHVDLDGSDGWTLRFEQPGAHVVRAVATDGVGFEGEAEAWVVVLQVPPLLALPALALGLRHRRAGDR